MTANGKIGVFLVDDVVELRTLVRLALEEDPDIEVVGEAANGREGVRGRGRDAARRRATRPLDARHGRPGGPPADAGESPDTRLVVLSGHEAGRVSLEALDQGASRYLNKAADFGAIRAAVHEVAKLEQPFTDERFSIVHQMWNGFLNGAIDDVLQFADADMVWRPCLGGRELRSPQEVRSFWDELVSGGNVVDPRAYGVEPRFRGLIVAGTLEIRGAGQMSETPVYWAFCFRGPKVALAAGFDRHEEAVEILRERCAA